jgi:hypothetical protein
MAAAWFNCTIGGAQVDAYGVSPPVVSVVLTDLGGSFGPTGFPVPDEAKHEILAVALAAISTKSQVSALVDPPTAPPWQCYTLSINAS